MYKEVEIDFLMKRDRFELSAEEMRLFTLLNKLSLDMSLDLFLYQMGDKIHDKSIPTVSLM